MTIAVRRTTPDRGRLRAAAFGAGPVAFALGALALLIDGAPGMAMLT